MIKLTLVRNPFLWPRLTVGVMEDCTGQGTNFRNKKKDQKGKFSRKRMATMVY